MHGDISQISRLRKSDYYHVITIYIFRTCLTTPAPFGLGNGLGVVGGAAATAAGGVVVGVVLVAGREGEHCGCHKEQHGQFFDVVKVFC